MLDLSSSDESSSEPLFVAAHNPPLQQQQQQQQHQQPQQPASKSRRISLTKNHLNVSDDDQTDELSASSSAALAPGSSVLAQAGGGGGAGASSTFRPSHPISVIVDKYSSSTTTSTNVSNQQQQQQQQPPVAESVSPSIQQPQNQKVFLQADPKKSNPTPTTVRRRSVAFTPATEGGDDVTAASDGQNRQSQSQAQQQQQQFELQPQPQQLQQPRQMIVTEDASATFQVASRRPSGAIGEDGVLMLGDEGLDITHETDDDDDESSVSFAPGSQPQQQQQQQKSQRLPLDDLGLEESEFNMFNSEFSLVPSASVPSPSKPQQPQRSVKTFADEENDRKVKEAADLEVKKEEERREKLLQFKKKQEGLQARIQKDLETVQADDEPRARTKLVQAFDQSVRETLWASAQSQRCFAIARQVFEQHQVIETRKTQIEDEREKFIAQICAPQWIRLFQKVVGERSRNLELVTEPQQRKEAISSIEESERRGIYILFDSIKNTVASKRKQLAELAQQRDQLCDTQEMSERETIVAEYNLVVTTSLSKKRFSLQQQHERFVFEFQTEQQERKQLEQEPFDREQCRTLAKIVEIHRQLQIKNRVNMESAFKDKIKQEIISEHKQMLERFSSEIRDRRRGELNKLEFELEADARTFVEEKLFRESLSEMRKKEVLSRTLITSNLSLKERKAAVERAHEEALRDVFDEFTALTLSESLYGFFFKRKLELAEQQSRRENVVSLQETERRTKLHLLARQTQSLLRQRLEKMEEEARLKFITNEYEAPFVSKTSSDLAKLRAAASIQHQLHTLLQQQQEPGGRRQIEHDDEVTARRSIIAEPFAAARSFIAQKEERARQERTETVHNALGVIERDEASIRQNVLIDKEYQHDFIDSVFKPQFLESFKRTQITELVRYGEVPKRRAVEADQSRRAAQVLVPAMNEWHRQHRVFLETSFTERFYRHQLLPEVEKFFDSLQSAANDSQQQVFRMKLLSIVDVDEPTLRHENILRLEHEERTRLASVFSNGARFIARSIVFRQESAKRAEISRQSESDFNGKILSLRLLLVAEEDARRVVRKIENNIAFSFFGKDARLLEIKAKIHFIYFQQEPSARETISKEERQFFLGGIVEPYIQHKMKAQSLALEREHREKRDGEILPNYISSTQLLFAQLQLQWDRTKRRVLLQKQEEHERKNGILEPEQKHREEIERDFDRFIKTVMKSIYERRSLEKEAYQSIVRSVFVAECEESHQIRRSFIDNLQYLDRRALALKMFVARNLHLCKNISVDSDKMLIVLKQEERAVAVDFLRRQYVFALSKKRLESGERLMRSAIITEFIKERARLFFGNQFHNIEFLQEQEARKELVKDECAKSFSVISEHIFRQQTLFRGKILTEYSEKSVKQFQQELRRIGFIGQEYYVERDRIRRYEDKSFAITALPAVQRQEFLHRKMISTEWEEILWRDIWIRNGLDMVSKNEEANRHALLSIEVAEFFDGVCKPQLVKSEAAVRYKLGEHGEEAIARTAVSFQMQKAGIHVWDALVRNSIGTQWLRFFQILQRHELTHRAPLEVEAQIVSQEKRERSIDVVFAEQQSKLFATVLEERQRMLLREEVIRNDQVVREFSSRYEADHDAIAAQEMRERQGNLRFASQKDRLFAASAFNLRRIYEQGLRDVALIQKWELTDREEVSRRNDVATIEEAEIAHVVNWESRLYVESKFLEKRAHVFHDFVLNPVIGELLFWMRNVVANSEVCSEESRQRTLLDAAFRLRNIQELDEPGQRNFLVADERDMRSRLSHHIFDSLAVGSALDLEVYGEEAKERRQLFILFDLGRVQFKENFVRRNLLNWEARDLRTETFIRGIVEFESVSRNEIAAKEESLERRNVLDATFARLQLRALEARERKSLIEAQRVDEFCDIGKEEVEKRLLASRSLNVISAEKQERQNLILVKIASNLQATLEVTRKTVNDMERQQWNTLQRLELWRRSEQLKAEEFTDQISKVNDIVVGGFHRGSEEEDRGEERKIGEPSDSRLGLLADAWSAICRLRDERLRAEREAIEARDRELYVDGFASTKFALSKGLPTKYEELYSTMSRPSEIARERAAGGGGGGGGGEEKNASRKNVADGANDEDNDSARSVQVEQNWNRRFLSSDLHEEKNRSGDFLARRSPIPTLPLSRPGTANYSSSNYNNKNVSASGFNNNNDNNEINVRNQNNPTSLSLSLVRPVTAVARRAVKPIGDDAGVGSRWPPQQQQQPAINNFGTIVSSSRPSTATHQSNQLHQLFYRPSSASAVVMTKRPYSSSPLNQGKLHPETISSNRDASRLPVSPSVSSLLPLGHLSTPTPPGPPRHPKMVENFVNTRTIFAEDETASSVSVAVSSSSSSSTSSVSASGDHISNVPPSSAAAAATTTTTTTFATRNNVTKTATALTTTFDEFHYSRPTSACPSFVNPSRRHFHVQQQHQQQQQAFFSRPQTVLGGRVGADHDEEKCEKIIARDETDDDDVVVDVAHHSNNGKSVNRQIYSSQHQRIQSALVKGANFLKQVSASIEKSSSPSQEIIRSCKAKRSSSPSSEPAAPYLTPSCYRFDNTIHFNSGLDTDFAVPGGTGELLIEATRNRLLMKKNGNIQIQQQTTARTPVKPSTASSSPPPAMIRSSFVNSSPPPPLSRFNVVPSHNSITQDERQAQSQENKPPVAFSPVTHSSVANNTHKSRLIDTTGASSAATSVPLRTPTLPPTTTPRPTPHKNKNLELTTTSKKQEGVDDDEFSVADDESTANNLDDDAPVIDFGGSTTSASSFEI